MMKVNQAGLNGFSSVKQQTLREYRKEDYHG